MAARENQHISLDKANAAGHTIGSQDHVFRRLASGTAVAKQLPVRTLLMNIHCTAALVVAVVPLDQILVDFSHIAETCQFTGMACAPQGAGQDHRESHPLQPPLESASNVLAVLG